MKYRNMRDEDLNLIGHGIVKAGDVIDTDSPLNNANFELVSEPPKVEKPKEKETAKKTDTL